MSSRASTSEEEQRSDAALSCAFVLQRLCHPSLGFGAKPFGSCALHKGRIVLERSRTLCMHDTLESRTLGRHRALTTACSCAALPTQKFFSHAPSLTQATRSSTPTSRAP